MKLPMTITAAMLAITASAAPAGDNPAPDPAYTVIINNTCHRDIRVAVHYRHPQRGWVTQGWWEVPARSELPTGIQASDNRFYMHGDRPGPLQWPPERSRKQYNRYAVMQDDFLLDDAAQQSTLDTAPFSLKEVPQDSSGLKARFDC